MLIMKIFSTSGLVGNIIQLSFLSLCVVSVWLPGSPASFLNHNHNQKVGEEINISVLVLCIGIITSRPGLWIADLTITQLQQEYVPAHERGTKFSHEARGGDRGSAPPPSPPIFPLRFNFTVQKVEIITFSSFFFIERSERVLEITNLVPDIAKKLKKRLSLCSGFLALFGCPLIINPGYVADELLSS